jgi:hypothetical protein
MVLWIGLVVGSRARAFPRGHREQQQPTATANLMVPHRLPCPRPGAAEAGTWLPRQERKRGGLRIDEFIHNFYNPKDFDKLRNSLADLKSTPARIAVLSTLQSRMLKDLHEPKNKDIKQALHEILNFFEAMGQDVKLAVVDSDYLKE